MSVHVNEAWAVEVAGHARLVSSEATKFRTIWADDVFVSTAIGKPDAELSKAASEDVCLERDLDMVMLIEAKMKLLRKIYDFAFIYDFGQRFVE